MTTDFIRGYEQAREDMTNAVAERASKMAGMFSEKAMNDLVGAFAGVITKDIRALAPPPASHNVAGVVEVEDTRYAYTPPSVTSEVDCPPPATENQEDRQ